MTNFVIVALSVAMTLSAQAGSFNSDTSSKNRSSGSTQSSSTPPRAPTPTPPRAPTPTPTPRPAPPTASVPAKSGFSDAPREHAKSVDAGATAKAFSREAEKSTTAKAWTSQQKATVATAAVATGVAAGVILHQQQKAADEKAAAKATESVRSTNPTTASTDRQIREAKADAAKARREARWSQEKLDRANENAHSSYWRGRNDGFYWGNAWHPQPQPPTQVTIVNGGNSESHITTSPAPATQYQAPSASSQGESESGFSIGKIMLVLLGSFIAGISVFFLFQWWTRRQEQQETAANYVPKYSLKGGNQGA